MKHITLSLIGGLASLGLGTAAHAQTPGNVVLIIADDLGTDQVGLYGLNADPAPTPNIDQLAQGGQIYREAWANPTCSPTRASIYTGRHAFRHGVGAPITDDQDAELAVGETTLPELLSSAGYDNALIGKWHLGDAGTEAAPCAAPTDNGFATFRGALDAALSDHYDWDKCVGTRESHSTTWSATDNVDDALAFLQGPRTGPFLLTVAFNLTHTPWQIPPAGAYSDAGRCPINGRTTMTNRDCYRTMIESLDVEIGRLMTGIDLTNTTVIFVGDNGTPGQGTATDTYPGNKAKGTVYQGGVKVPMIIKSPAISDAGWVEAPIEALDIFATVAELAGVTSTTSVDSNSLVPFFSQRTHAPLQPTIYSEGFDGADDCSAGDAAAIRGARYKLIRDACQTDELYDLENDPYEATDLLQGTLTVREQAAYTMLSQAMVSLRGH